MAATRLAQPDLPGGDLDRPFGRGRPLRQQRCAARQHAHRDRPQRRALPLHEMGGRQSRQLPGVPARHGHHAHDQPRAPDARRRVRDDRRRALGPARHAARHRQPYADDQRGGRAGLGRGRPRGRGRHVRAAPGAAAARGRGRPADRQAAPWSARHRRGADRDRTVAPDGRGRQVRRVLRPRRRGAERGRARCRRQHGAGVRRHDRLLPARRAGPRLSARDRPRPWPAAVDRGLCAAAGPLARAGPDPGLRQHPRARPRQGRAVAGRPEAAAGPAAPGTWPRPRSAGPRTSRTT